MMNLLAVAAACFAAGAVLAQAAPKQSAGVPEGYVLDPPPCKNGRTDCEPWERAWPKNDRIPYEKDQIVVPPLGPGPHVLVISDGQAMTRVDYKSGAACQKARDQVRLQTDARLTNRNPNVIYGAPRVSAFCVPR